MSIKSAKIGNCDSLLFADMLKVFQELDRRLEYPNCEGYADEKRITKSTEEEFYKTLKKWHRG
jgi:hypothetical protein